MWGRAVPAPAQPAQASCTVASRCLDVQVAVAVRHDLPAVHVPCVPADIPFTARHGHPRGAPARDGTHGAMTARHLSAGSAGTAASQPSNSRVSAASAGSRPCQGRAALGDLRCGPAHPCSRTRSRRGWPPACCRSGASTGIRPQRQAQGDLPAPAPALRSNKAWRQPGEQVFPARRSRLGLLALSSRCGRGMPLPGGMASRCLSLSRSHQHGWRLFSSSSASASASGSQGHLQVPPSSCSAGTGRGGRQLTPLLRSPCCGPRPSRAACRAWGTSSRRRSLAQARLCARGRAKGAVPSREARATLRVRRRQARGAGAHRAHGGLWPAVLRPLPAFLVCGPGAALPGHQHPSLPHQGADAGPGRPRPRARQRRRSTNALAAADPQHAGPGAHCADDRVHVEPDADRQGPAAPRQAQARPGAGRPGR